MDNKIIFDYCSDAIVSLDYHGAVLMLNKQAEKLFNISVKKVKGLSFFEALKKRNTIIPFSLEYLRTIKVNQPCFFDGDILLQEPGQQKYLICWTICRYTPNDSKNDQFIIMGKDTSEVEHYKISFQDYRMYLNNIIENLPQFVYWKDINLIYQGCNNRVAQYLGLKSPLDIIGKTDNDFHWNKTRVRFLHKIDAVILQKGITKVVEDAIPGEEGSISFMLTSKAPLRNERNEIVGIVGISFDITDRKNMEKALYDAKIAAEAASKAKSEFIANMSHDIRTPITGILGLVEELINTAEDTLVPPQSTSQPHQLVEKVREDGQLILGATDELLQLLNGILEDMHLKSGNETEKEESFNVWKLVEHNIELMLPMAHHKQLQLLCNIDETVPTHFKGLRTYLDRTLLNLLSNALKFTNAGYVAIKVDVLHQEYRRVYCTGDKVQLRISVQDSGIGIPKDKFEIIFENFSRLTPSYQGVYKGVGLGLYMVKNYVNAMEGTIRVESDVGKGSTFIMTFPLIVSDGADHETPSYRMQQTMVNTQKISSSKKNISKGSIPCDFAKRILIVEDNLIAAKAVKANINRLYPNCVCDIAENGLLAVQMAEEHPYCLILMDIGLPDIDGIEVTKRIRASSSHLLMQTPIVALTGHVSTWDKKEEALAAGMQDVFTKPLPPFSLDSLMQQYVFKPKQKLVLCKESRLIKSAVQENVQVIDWAKCLEQCGGDEKWLRELLSELASDLRISQARLEQFYAAQDYNALRAELHRVCGGVAYLTIPQLDKTLAKFHKAVSAEPKNRKELEDSYGDLQRAMNAFWDNVESNIT